MTEFWKLFYPLMYIILSTIKISFKNVNPANFCLRIAILNTDALQAEHAESLGSDALLCLPELFNKPQTVDELVRYLKYVAQAAPKTPLLYYHIPSYTGVNGKYNVQVGVTVVNVDILRVFAMCESGLHC
jgi:hypothetical protein